MEASASGGGLKNSVSIGVQRFPTELSGIVPSNSEDQSAAPDSESQTSGENSSQRSCSPKQSERKLSNVSQFKVAPRWSLNPQGVEDQQINELAAIHHTTILLDKQDNARAFSRFVLLPGSRVRLTWDLVVVAATLAACMLMPLSGVYLQEAKHNTDPVLNAGNIDTYLSLIDVIWIVDIVLNFRTAVIDGGKVMMDPTVVAMAYARGWLALDLFTAWPIGLVPTGSASNFYRVLKLLRLPRAMRTLDMVQNEAKWKWFMPAKVMLVLALAAHFLSCAWRLTGGNEESLTMLSERWWHVYVKDVYFIMMTLSSVGYGDITPQNNAGRIFTICIMALAPFFSGCIITLLTYFTGGLLNDEIQNQVVQAARFMRQRRVPLELQRRVEYDLRCRMQQESQLSLAPFLLSKLSSSLQRELTLELLSSTVLHFPMFLGAPPAFIAEIARAHAWVQCSVGDLIVEAGQLESEVVFVVVGRLLAFMREEDFSQSGLKMPAHNHRKSQVNIRDDHGRSLGREVTLCPGAWFGEACLVIEEVVRKATVFAHIDSELAVLQAAEYNKIVHNYPSLLLRHGALQKELVSGSLSLADLAYKANQKSTQSNSRFWSLLVHREGSAKVFDSP